MNLVTRALPALVVCVLFGCAAATAPGSSPDGRLVPARSDAGSSATPIKHVIVVIQENRSFDNFFAGYPGSDSTMVGKTHDGKSVPLKPITFSRVSLNHFFRTGELDYNHGAMNGFDLARANPPFTKLEPYSYVERSLVKPYWTMAQQYVLADHMFPTEFGPSFTAHLNLIAGTTEISSSAAVVDLPTLNNVVQAGDCDDPKGTVTDLITSSHQYLKDQGPFPCFDFPTLAKVMDPAGVSWKYYEAFWPGGGNSIWNTYGAIRSVRYGPDWSRNVIKTPMQVLTDAAGGNLPAVSWVLPTMADSDHPGAGSDTGPSWVATVVNTIGNSADWNSSVIIVVWDDWGGWYDNLAPPQLDYRGLGLRTPCLIISPYAKAGYVEHTQYEFGSILKTIEELYGLPALGTTDARANGMLDAFDFAHAPRKFQTIPVPYPVNHFLHEPPSNLDLDD